MPIYNGGICYKNYALSAIHPYYPSHHWNSICLLYTSGGIGYGSAVLQCQDQHLELAEAQVVFLPDLGIQRAVKQPLILETSLIP